MSVWLAEREEQLRRRDEQLQERSAEVNQRLQTWSDTRDRWIRERTEAEEIIRGLLLQLSDVGDPLNFEPPAAPTLQADARDDHAPPSESVADAA